MKTEKEYRIINKYLRSHPSYKGFENIPNNDTKLIVVIPVYNEKEYIFKTFESLLSCYKPSCAVEVLMVFNASENDTGILIENQKETVRLIREHYNPNLPGWLTLQIIECYNLPSRHFGAGLARKVGMDAALTHFNSIGRSDGIIVSLDADTLVKPNYLTEIYNRFTDKSLNGACIYFEHPIKGSDFQPEVYDGIRKYELHLRYYLQALRITGFPYSFHTMGSAIALRAQAYARIGGMPRKQAGEDFYFLQKLIPLGNFGEINKTAVFPSPRPSNRVIFGTGAAITRYISGDNYVETTYNLQSFFDLKELFDRRMEIFKLEFSEYESWSYKLPGPIRSFLLNSDFFTEMDFLKKECSIIDVFCKRFYEVFNSFKIVKYLNYSHANFYSKSEVFDAALMLIEKLGVNTENFFLEEELLNFYRNLEKDNESFIS